MKRKLTVTLLLLTLYVSMLHAAGRIWFNNSPMVSKTNMTFDLSKTIYKPRVDISWGNSGVNGTYNSSNYVAQFGASGTSHRLIITITTDGKFVSQSDPTKYRAFSMSMNPVYGVTYNGGGGYKWMPTGELTQVNGVYTNGYPIANTDYFPNTAATGSASLYAPITNGSSHYVDSAYTVNTIRTYWIDFLLCLDPLDTEALKHLSINDDYLAEIHISWTCAEHGTACTEVSDGYAHNGSTILRIRGYYGQSDSLKDDAYLFIVPNSNATNINIRELAGSGRTLNVGTLQLHTTPATSSYNEQGTGKSYAWNSNVYIYASSSPLSTASSEHFALKQVGGTKSIPYTIRIYSEDGTQLLKEYDGTDYFVPNGTNKGTVYNKNYIPLGDMTLTSDRYGNTFSQIDFYGQIHISIPDTIDNSDGSYSGAYASMVYFNILCNK